MFAGRMDEAVNGSEEDIPGVEFESDFLSALKSGGDERADEIEFELIVRIDPVAREQMQPKPIRNGSSSHRQQQLGGNTASDQEMYVKPNISALMNSANLLGTAMMNLSRSSTRSRWCTN
ncbi:hypothetical protein pipiens_011593 [Culex pipiens pipiens]|uniref:Uncharacterized protein n=1 Tax=Culex pipiens pipiens TaxID=38569 RepID=A0ABD1D5M8_CULPP